MLCLQSLQATLPPESTSLGSQLPKLDRVHLIDSGYCWPCQVGTGRLTVLALGVTDWQSSDAHQVKCTE